jgi:predicted HTH domain antitoxin
MPTLTAEEVNARPQRLLEDALRGHADVVTIDGDPAMLTLPLGPAGTDDAERLNLAVSLYEHELISLGLAAKVAGLSYSRMVDELGQRQVPVVRYGTEDLDRELAYVRNLAGRG